MSDITQNFEINSIDLGVTVDTNQLTFTPDGISLNIYAGGVGTSNSLTADIANVHIFGGVNGYVLQTDGTGNLDWTAMTGGGGNGSPGGANTQVQYNDSGLFGGNVGFTFNEVTGSLNIANTIINANGIVTPGYYGDISGCNVLSTITVTASGTISAADANLGNVVTANYFVGNLYGNSNIANTVSNATQSNITTVGTLTNLTVAGNISTGNSIGFASGTSGAVTQSSSRTTGVTLNTPTGKITLFSTTISANAQQQFTLTNSYISATDMVLINHISGGTMGLYNVTATPGSGNAVISIRNNSAAASNIQQPVLQFMILKA